MTIKRSLLLALVLVLVDQAVKFAIQDHLALGSQVVVIPGLLALTNLHNSGAAWSILVGQQTFFILLTIAAIAAISYFLYRTRRQPYYQLALALLLAGAVGNFIDRLAQGYVVDMFEVLFVNFPVFNVADSCLTVGVVILFLLVLFEKDGGK